jgi:ADP-ribose pyrophosphatase YjhB (NUDIX family)
VICEFCDREFDPIATRWLCPWCHCKAHCCDGAPLPERRTTMGTRTGIDCVGVTIVFFCHDGHGRLLMGKRTDQCRDEHGCWDPGGGELEFGATPESTLKAEVHEEYRTEILAHSFLGYRNVLRLHNGARTHWLALDFEVLVDPATVRNGEPLKMSEVKFFPFDALPSPLHSQMRAAWGRYRGEIAIT